ncbi:MAG: aldehyde dehydrogenase [Planctomycetota bacterium]|jgi:acyl-CoA reductase-like NAD-dependent aldehyde dehydrogenase
MNKIVEKQREFFTNGETKSITYRLRMLKTLRKAILAFEQEIFEALHADLKKSKLETYTTEIGQCLSEITFVLRHMKKWMKPQRVGGSKLFPLSSGWIVSEPLGISLILSPWNYPFRLAVLPLIASLAAGNCVILKPSEISKNTERVIAKMITEHFDDRSVSVVCGGPDTAQRLLEHKFDHIFYTGGETIGKVVMKAAALHVTPVVLELGGKSPCVVDENCSLERAAKRITWGKFLNAGQTCVAPDFLLVHKNAKEKLIKEMKKRIEKFYGQRPCDSANYGRIINESHFDRLSKLLKDGNVVLGGQINREELYISPSVIENIPENTSLMNEEIFGPILPILEFDNVSGAIDLINKNPKPLALYIFSQDKGFQQRIIAETSSGGVCINDTIVHLSVPNLPFGGVGKSGFGRYHGKAGFDTFSNPKSVFRQTMLFDIPKRFPPADELGLKILRHLLK